MRALNRLFLACTLLAPATTHAAPTGSEVKAAYLFNFASFVEWPPAAFGSSSEPLAVCVFGDDPFGRVLDDTLAGERVAGRPLAARRIGRPAEAAGCQIVFVGTVDGRQTAEILRALDGRPTLTVGDTEDFTRQGGMVTFVMEGARVRFRVNPSAVARSGLVMSSQLLRLARVD
jgi:hypothetical protein